MDSRLDDDLRNDSSDRGPGEDAIDQLSYADIVYSDTELNTRPYFSTLDWHKLKSELLLQQSEPESFQGAQTSTLMPPIQSPTAVQGRGSLQKQLPEYSTPDELKVKPMLPLQESKHDSFQGAQTSTLIPPSQSPAAVQGQGSLQKQLPEYSTPDEFRVQPVLPLQESERDSFRRTQSSTFTPTNQLPPDMQRHVSLQNEPATSIDLRLEKLQGSDFMHHIPLNPHRSTDQALFSLPKEGMPHQAGVYTVPVYVQPQHQQFLQQMSSHQQLQQQVNPISFLIALPHSSMSMHTPPPPVVNPEEKSSLQTSLEHLSKEPTPEEIEEIEKMQGFAGIFKNMEKELDFRMGGDLPNARQDQKTCEETDSKISDKDCCASVKEINDTLGHLSTERIPEEMEKIGQIQKSEVCLKKQRAELDAGMDGDLRNSKSSAITGKNTDGKTSDDTRQESDTENKISRVPQLTEPNPEHERRSKEEEMRILAETFKIMEKELEKERRRKEEEMRILAETLKIRRKELGYTQETIRDALNELSVEHNMRVVLPIGSIHKIEAEKYSLIKMLEFKPLLELWLESNPGK